MQKTRLHTNWIYRERKKMLRSSIYTILSGDLYSQISFSQKWLIIFSHNSKERKFAYSAKPVIPNFSHLRCSQPAVFVRMIFGWNHRKNFVKEASFLHPTLKHFKMLTAFEKSPLSAENRGTYFGVWQSDRQWFRQVLVKSWISI